MLRKMCSSMNTVFWSSRRNTVTMTIDQLAQQLNVKTNSIMNVLKKLGEEHKTPNTCLSSTLVELVSLEMGHLPTKFMPKEATPIQRPPNSMKPRPPVVTVMGHVDHGKTTLLDNLRKTSVASGEAGGITQHIGAFSVPLKSGEVITFLDTPGHAAFTKMRSRGANVTDIIVLVVAADDGVMNQTRECIKLAKQEDVPVIVAINKCDKFEVNIPKVQQQLLQNGLQLEGYGGDIQAVNISALTGHGLDDLVEAILALAELKDLRADPDRLVEGVILEAKTSKKTGSLATVLVLQGTLKKGCVLVAGRVWGKVRGLSDDKGHALTEVTPSTPAVMTGWKEVPTAGDKCIQVMGESLANELIQYRKGLQSRHQLTMDRRKKYEREGVKERVKQTIAKGSKQDWRQIVIERRKKREAIDKAIEREKIEWEENRVVSLIIKGDVIGSVEVLEHVLNSSQQPKEIGIKVIHSGVGDINESDIDAAVSVDGVILAYNVNTASKMIEKLANQRHVKIISHDVIYKLLEELKDWLESQLPDIEVEETVGEANVIAVFKLRGSKKAYVGGCYVTRGQLIKDELFQLWRKEQLVHQGKLIGMKREKDDINVALRDMECGLSYSQDPGWQIGDKVKCIKKSSVSQTLTWNIVGFKKYETDTSNRNI